jgi:hypothetical protein
LAISGFREKGKVEVVRKGMLLPEELSEDLSSEELIAELRTENERLRSELEFAKKPKCKDCVLIAAHAKVNVLALREMERMHEKMIAMKKEYEGEEGV